MIYRVTKEQKSKQFWQYNLYKIKPILFLIAFCVLGGAITFVMSVFEDLYVFYCIERVVAAVCAAVVLFMTAMIAFGLYNGKRAWDKSHEENADADGAVSCRLEEIDGKISIENLSSGKISVLEIPEGSKIIEKRDVLIVARPKKEDILLPNDGQIKEILRRLI